MSMQSCKECGVEVEHRLTHERPLLIELLAAAVAVYRPGRHTAPCGRPCAAGGLTGEHIANVFRGKADTHRTALMGGCTACRTGGRHG